MSSNPSRKKLNYQDVIKRAKLLINEARNDKELQTAFRYMQTIKLSHHLEYDDKTELLRMYNEKLLKVN